MDHEKAWIASEFALAIADSGQYETAVTAAVTAISHTESSDNAERSNRLIDLATIQNQFGEFEKGLEALEGDLTPLGSYMILMGHMSLGMEPPAYALATLQRWMADSSWQTAWETEKNLAIGCVRAYNRFQQGERIRWTGKITRI